MVTLEVLAGGEAFRKSHTRTFRCHAHSYIKKSTVGKNKGNAVLPLRKERRKNLPKERNHVLWTMCQGGAGRY